MIKITIDLVPWGDESRRETIAEGKIWNTGAGTRKRGTYQFRFWKKTQRSAKYGEVELEEAEPIEGGLAGFPRLSYSVWELIKQCLNSIEVK